MMDSDKKTELISLRVSKSDKILIINYCKKFGFKISEFILFSIYRGLSGTFTESDSISFNGVSINLEELRKSREKKLFKALLYEINNDNVADMFLLNRMIKAIKNVIQKNVYKSKKELNNNIQNIFTQYLDFAKLSKNKDTDVKQIQEFINDFKKGKTTLKLDYEK